MNTPYAKGSDTSEAAADSIAPDVNRLAKLVYDTVRDAGSIGTTTDMLEYALGMRHQTASARVWELTHKGLIKDSGARRKTRSGRNAAVYVIT